MKKSRKYLSPSILGADLANLGQALSFTENNGASFVHIDVMDGSFVPQISYGQPVISSIRKCTKLPFDVHLMVDKPENCVQSFIDAGADFVTFHVEATHHADRCLQLIRRAGKKAGVALCPGTSLSAVEEILSAVDIVLVMTVNPGWGGQKFITRTVEKVAKLADIQREKGWEYLISVDGGINQETLRCVLDAGVDIVVSGSSFFTGNLKWK